MSTEKKRHPLAEADALLEEERAAREAAREAKLAKENEQKKLTSDGKQLFDALMASLYTTALQAESVHPKAAGLGMGQGGMRYWIPFPDVAAESFNGTKWQNVAFGGAIEVKQEGAYPGRSANLWYADIGNGFGLWEVSYFASSRVSKPVEPFAVRELTDAVGAVAYDMSVINLAHAPRRVDGKGQDEFIERWLKWLGLASHGKLAKPSRLPE